MPLDGLTRRAKPPAKTDPHADARAELDGALTALLARAKTAKSREVLAYWAASRAQNATMSSRRSGGPTSPSRYPSGTVQADFPSRVRCRAAHTNREHR
jgi:hypothetical protein